MNILQIFIKENNNEGKKQRNINVLIEIKKVYNEIGEEKMN